MLHRYRLFIVPATLLLAIAFSYGQFFGPVDERGETRTIVIAPDETIGELADRLKEEGLIRSRYAFEVAYVKESGSLLLRPGGYALSPAYDAWRTAATLSDTPYLSWVKVPRGRRKEEIASILAKALGWHDGQKQEWLSASDAWPAAYREGVFFPDTYLIPSDQPPRFIAEGMRARFEESFSALAQEAARQNLKWTTVVRMASLIEREAAGPHDMPIIAGIMWNRLDRNMRLQIDASLQYVKGNEEDGWWGTVRSEDKYLESEYNTYRHEGLPPPISNPGLDSLTAVLHPEATNCLYYLHDYQGTIHCSPNYSGHVANIRKYLQ